MNTPLTQERKRHDRYGRGLEPRVQNFSSEFKLMNKLTFLLLQILMKFNIRHLRKMSEILRLKQVYNVLPEEVRASQSDSRTFRLPPVGGCIISQSPPLNVSRQHTGQTKNKSPYTALTAHTALGLISNKCQGHWWQNDPKEQFLLAQWRVSYPYLLIF